MQTFLPYPDFRTSLATLDKRRLGKQRVEAYQIIKAIHDPNYGWQNHPAVKMWRNYPLALTAYYNISLEEFAVKGGHNIKLSPFEFDKDAIILPHWLGNEDFHASHRSNLLRKDSRYYGQFRWLESDSLPYVWPR